MKRKILPPLFVNSEFVLYILASVIFLYLDHIEMK